MASLKQSIVVKSRFSVPHGNGKGSRGSTPGQFVMRYMSRATATENISPTRLSEADSYIKRFQERENAILTETDIPTIKHRMRNAQKYGGVAFGNDDTSLSDQKLRQKSKEIQDLFDRGHTVMETVLSFSDEYLRSNGILDEDFDHVQRGDYAGHIDQLKLRLAIMNGLSKMGRNFDDLQYVGAVQVDTDHVHCHLVMVDAGAGTKKADGTQRGKLSALDIKNLRRGIDAYLDEKQTVKMMSSSVFQDKRNALCYIKRFTHQTMAQQGFPQFLLACLPENRNHWSASSNRIEMRKANALTREFVLDVLQPDAERPSPMYQKAHQSIVAYADARQRREGISNSERLKLIRNGEEQLIKDCMNGVYSVLKRIPKEQMVVRTPMLDAMSMDYESMSALAVNDPMMEFSFKLRSYSSRLKHHRDAFHKFRKEYDDYEKAENKTPESKALGDHLKLERDYQQMLMVKYQYFLMFLPPDASVEDEFEAVMKEQTRLRAMQTMTDDPAFARMGQMAADDYGWQVYGINRGSQIHHLPAVWERRLENEETKYDDMVKAFRERLQDHGFDFDGHGVTRQKLYAFDDVKALDLHHLGYDFPYDVHISKKNIDAFVNMANSRYESFEKARFYLEHTGQAESVEFLMPQDVQSMKQFADKLMVTPSLQSARPDDVKRHKGVTVRLGVDYSLDIREVVRSTAETTRLFES